MRTVYGLLALSVLIVLHELGHLLAAKIFQVDVLRMTLGVGPPLFSFRRGGTTYALAAVPLGGAVEIRGMNPHQGNEQHARSFLTRAPWQRVAMLLAGSIANYLVAWGVLTALYVSGTHVPVPMTVGAVEPGSEAARAQLRPGDEVVSLDGATVPSWSALVEHVGERAFEQVTLGIRREGETRSVAVRPRPDETGVGRLGLRQQYVFRQHTFREGASRAFAHTGILVLEGFSLLGQLVRGKADLEPATPTAVYRQASKAASGGLDAFLRVVCGVSLALALFYLLPLPALDGGRALFVVLEALAGRRVNPRVETFLHFVGFFALVALVLLVVLGEVRQVRGWGGRASPQVDAGSER